MAQVVVSSSSHSSSKIVGSKNENIEIIVLEMRVYMHFVYLYVLLVS